MNAQNRFTLIKKFPLFINLIKASILYKFSERRTTSAALMLSSDFALILTPIDAYCRQGISFKPSPTIIILLLFSFCCCLIHYIFMKALCYPCWHYSGIPKDSQSLATLYLESPDNMWTYFPRSLIFLIASAASGLKFEWVFKKIISLI